MNLQNARCNNKDMKEGFHLTDKCAPTPVAARLSLGSAAARLLGLSFRIQQGAWISLSCECSVLSEFSESGSSLVQRSPTECYVSKCDREASTLRRSCRTKGTCAIGGRGWGCVRKIQFLHHSRLPYYTGQLVKAVLSNTFLL